MTWIYLKFEVNIFSYLPPSSLCVTFEPDQELVAKAANILHLDLLRQRLTFEVIRMNELRDLLGVPSREPQVLS